MRLPLLFALLLTLPGCGSESTGSGAPTGVDLSGMYLVTHHTYNTGDCSTEGSPTISVTYFRAFRGSTGFYIVACASADASSCPTDPMEAILAGDMLGIVDTPTKDGWSMELPSSSTRSGCALSYGTTSVVLYGSDLRLEDRQYGQAGDPGNCTSTEAQRLGATMSCEHFRMLVGKRQ
jgi:hypothetical protein